LSKPIRPLRWVGSSYDDYREFPDAVQDAFGFELFLAQVGQHPPSAKPLKGLANGAIELVEELDGDTYRAVYTVQLKTGLYVLQDFKKKSKHRIATPKRDIDLIARRLRDAEGDDRSRQKTERKS
jgi:phage-related protein